MEFDGLATPWLKDNFLNILKIYLRLFPLDIYYLEASKMSNEIISTGF